jgi:phage gpG-like protein
MAGGAAFFQLSIHGDVQVSRRLERFAHRAGDASPLWHNIIEYLERAEVRQFNSQGATGSGGWKPLASTTKEYKRLAGLDPRILHATLALRDSLTKGGGDAVRVVTDQSMGFGTTVPYARFHQLGEGVPMRKPLELTEGQRKTIAKRIQRWIVTGDVYTASGGL